MDDKVFNQLTTTPTVDVRNEEWYRTADAIFNARMADYYNPGVPGGYQSYLLEARKYKTNLDPLQTMGYLHAQQTIDSNWEYTQNMAKSVYNGAMGVFRDTLNGIRAARDYNIALLNEQAAAQGIERNPDQGFIDALDNASKAEVLQPYDIKRSASRLGQFGLDVAQGAGQLAGQMVGSVALNAVLPVVGGPALMMAQITGGQYEDLKAKGVDTKRAATAAFYNAAFQTPFEYLALTKLMKRIPAGSVFKRKLRMVLEDAATEGLTEMIQQFPEEWAELWALNPDKSWKELKELAAKKFPDTMQNALYAGMIGAVLGAGSRGIHLAIDRNVDLVLRKEIHDEAMKTVEGRIDNIKQSGISPDYAAETINANLNNATVLIDGRVLQAYAQKAGEEKAAEKLGVSKEDIAEASSHGDTVEVKQGNFEALAASDPSFLEMVRDDVSFDPRDMSNNAYKQIQVNMETYSKMAEEQRKELKEQVDKIAASALETGRVSKSGVEGLKVLLTRFALTARPDDPAQFWKDNPVRFERGMERQAAPNFSSNEEKANLVKDILDTNYDNPREEVENRIKAIDEEIERTPEGSENLQILKAHRDILTSLLSGGDTDVPAIENYKQHYNRDNGTFDSTYHQSGLNNMSAMVITPNQQQKRTTDSLMNYEKLSIDNIKKRDPEAFKKIITLVKKIPGLGVKDATDEEAYQHMKKRVADNLVWLYNLVTDPEDRKRAKLWYEGGRKMIKSWSDRYGISVMAGAGAMAVLSPQKDWFMNVNMTERILDTMFADRFKPWTKEMTDKARGTLKEDGSREDDGIVKPLKRGTDLNMPALDRAEGKTLDELLKNRDYYAAAIWIRVYDEVYNSEKEFGENNRGYKILTPEGGTGDYVKTQGGEKANMAWQGYGNIAKAVSIIANPSYTNVSLQLGTNHKVRNFFNNLYNPDAVDFATIDTHAVAAAALIPYSASSEAVNDNFGGLSSTESGASGTYAFFLEAYRDAADEVGISPREMQSITWEMVRILFTDTFKKDVDLKDENGNYILDEKGKRVTGPNENVLAIQKAWEEADKIINEYTGADKEGYEKKVLEKTRKKVYNMVDKVKPVGKFAWHDTAFQPEVGDTYDRSRIQLINSVGVDNKLSRTQISVEVAPDPNNEALTALWDSLSDKDKETISKQVAKQIINLVLNEYDSDAVFSVQVGGYEGKTNPSLNISVDKPELAVPIAKMLGYALNQDSMFITSYAPFLGAKKSKGVAINVGTMGIEDARQLYDKLYTITNDAGNNVITGYSLSDGVITIIFDEKKNGMTVDELIDRIVEATPEYDNETRPIEVYMAAPQRVRENADTDIYGYLPPLPQMETKEALKAKARDIVAERKAQGIKATINGVTEELINEQKKRLEAVKEQWVDILLPEIEEAEQAVIAQSALELSKKENITIDDAVARLRKEEADTIAKRNKEREEMLNAKSITERVDWSVATLDRRADYIRSQADAAIRGGISEAQRRKNESARSGGNTGKGFKQESGTAEGSGQLLGQAEEGTGDRVTLNQTAYRGAMDGRISTDLLGDNIHMQAHGWGLNFTSSKQVAEWYKHNRSQHKNNMNDVVVDGKTIAEWMSDKEKAPILVAYRMNGYNYNDTLNDIEADADIYDAEALQWFKENFKDLNADTGVVYEANIPENDVLLNENKTLKEQPKSVQRAIEKIIRDMTPEQLEDAGQDVGRIGEEKARANVLKMLANSEGSKIYGTLTDIFGGQREASMKLNEYGVKGITYEGNENRGFVIFDDNAIDVLNKYYQNQQQTSQIKGEFDPFTDGEAVIRLFKGADPSTVIHETGHYFIESLWREIAAGRATKQQQADFEKLMQYCGLTTEQWGKLDTEGRRAAHERLAEAFETYIMEDKAPTRELRPVFKRFAKWLKAVYAAISRNKNAVPLTDEVREVFDRMLASEEDVEEMKRVEGYFAKLPKVITDNLSDATKKRIEDYILKAQDKAVEILTKERLANFSEERKREIENFRNIHADEIRQEVASRPLYVAARQAQELLGGEKAAPAKQYANLYLEEKMSDENEVKWEIVAEQNGMTPSELAQKILAEPSENEAYNAAMNEAVQKEFPDYYTEREQAEEATRMAMYNDESGILVGVEQVLIEDFATKAAAQQRSAETARKLAMAKRQQAKVAAQKELANMKLKDATNVNKYIAAERRCAVKSAESMAKKDYETARHYKDMQAFNHAMVLESANLKRRVQQYQKFLRRQFKSKRESWTSEIHFNQAMALFARMGMVRKDYDPTTRTQSLLEYLNEMGQMLYPFNEVPEWLADETWPITDPNNMRFDDYEKVIDLMRYIKTMAKIEKAANFFDSSSTYNEWKANAIENLNKLATKFTPILGEKQTATWLERFKAGYQTLDNFLERMDGWTFGFFSRSFGDVIKHANDNEYTHLEAYQKRKAEIEKAWCPTDEAIAEAGKDVYYKELGASANKFVLTKMLMNLGNEGNARKLCSSYPSEALRGSPLWVFPDGLLSRDEAIQQTKENLLEFLGRVLTKEDIAYAQAKIDLAGMYWGEMADLERRTKGFTPKKVEAYPVTLKLANGEEVVFRGGYFPLIRNGEMGSHPAGILPVSDTDPDQGRNVRTLSTSQGHMITRVEADYPVDLTDGSEDWAMRRAIHDLCWRETMTGFRRILNDPVMYGLMKSKLGIAQMNAMREMLENAAQPNNGQSMAMAEGLLATTAGWLRRKTVNSIVMLNLRINLQNFGNFFLYGNTVEGFGYSDVIAAMGNALSKGFDGKSFSEMWDFVDEKSAYMRERSTTPDITLAQVREEGKLNKFERSAMEWGAKAMMYTDGVTARPVWMQAYTKKINAGATEQEAIDFADTIIRRTLGSGRATDVASLQRGEPIYRLFTAFQGFFNTQFNQWAREYNIDRRLLAEGNTAEAVQRITAFVASKYLAACLFNLIFALQNPFADDDKDEYLNYTTELIHYPMSLIGIYGAVANEFIDQSLGMKSYGYRMSIIQSSLEKIYRAGGKTRKMIEGDFETGLEGITEIAGMAYGVPAQLNRLFWNAYDIFVNGMDPRLEDLTTRRPKRERKK